MGGSVKFYGLLRNCKRYTVNKRKRLCLLSSNQNLSEDYLFYERTLLLIQNHFHAHDLGFEDKTGRSLGWMTT